MIIWFSWYLFFFYK